MAAGPLFSICQDKDSPDKRADGDAIWEVSAPALAPALVGRRGPGAPCVIRTACGGHGTWCRWLVRPAMGIHMVCSRSPVSLPGAGLNIPAQVNFAPAERAAARLLRRGCLPARGAPRVLSWLLRPCVLLSPFGSQKPYRSEPAPLRHGADGAMLARAGP